MAPQVANTAQHADVTWRAWHHKLRIPRNMLTSPGGDGATGCHLILTLSLRLILCMLGDAEHMLRADILSKLATTTAKKEQ